MASPRLRPTAPGRCSPPAIVEDPPHQPSGHMVCFMHQCIVTDVLHHLFSSQPRRPSLSPPIQPLQPSASARRPSGQRGTRADEYALSRQINHEPRARGIQIWPWILLGTERTRRGGQCYHRKRCLTRIPKAAPLTLQSSATPNHFQYRSPIQ